MITIQITATGGAAGLQRLRRALSRRSQLHARIAVDALELTQTYVAGIPDHETANRLGAKPTMHLEQAATQIESTSTADAATLKIPRASRLRAAFGPYTVVPTGGRKFLTIPVAAEAYGRRAKTFKDLQFMRIGPKQTPVLARPSIGVKGDSPLNVLYVLVRKADIKEDRSLLPFDDIRDQALQTTADYVEELTNEAAAKKGGLA
jgi:hypothetical protein